jgi:hypothetical protein
MPKDRRADCHEWLIDEAGHLWPSRAPGLREKIGSDLPWKFLQRYAVENLGYCSVSSLPRGSHVKFRPQIIAQPTLVAAIYWLVEQRTPRLVISILREKWHDQIFTSNWSAVSHLSAEADAEFAARRGDFSSRRLSLDDLADLRPLTDLMHFASERNYVYDKKAFARLVEGPLQRRALVLVPSRDATRLTIKEWGAGYRTYSRSWLGLSKGLNVEDQRDFAYACKAATSYRLAWTGRESILEDVDARVLDEKGKLNHVRYTRIIIPMTDPDGGPVLMGASVVRPPVDIGSEGVKEP